jgi:hypothetical protein
MTHWPIAVAFMGCSVLAGCMTMDGPCQLEREADADRARFSMQCESGGVITIVAPGRVLEAAGQAASAAH